MRYGRWIDKYFIYPEGNSASQLHSHLSENLFIKRCIENKRIIKNKEEFEVINSNPKSLSSWS